MSIFNFDAGRCAGCWLVIMVVGIGGRGGKRFGIKTWFESRRESNFRDSDTFRSCTLSWLNGGLSWTLRKLT